MVAANRNESKTATPMQCATMQCATMSGYSCDVSSVRGRCSLSASRLNEPTMTKGDEMISGKRTSAYIGILQTHLCRSPRKRWWGLQRNDEDA